MIVIEGIEGSGKTTLFREIGRYICNRRHLNSVVMYPSNGAPTSEEEMLLRVLEEQRNLSNRRMITDRSVIISEYVYAGLNTGRRAVDLSLVTESFKSRGAFVIQCNSFVDETEASKAAYRDFWIDRVKRKYFKDSKICDAGAFDLVFQRYLDVFTYSVKPNLVWHYKTDDLDNVLEQVEHYLTSN